MIVTSTSFTSPRAGVLKLIVSRSAFHIRTRATLRAGRTRAAAICGVAGTLGSFPMKQFKVARRNAHTLQRFPLGWKWCIKLHGLSRVQTALDPFLGIGNSAVAAQRCAVKHFIGFE